MEAGVVGVGEGTSSSKRIFTTPAVPTNSLLLNITLFKIFNITYKNEIVILCVSIINLTESFTLNGGD